MTDRVGSGHSTPMASPDAVRTAPPKPDGLQVPTFDAVYDDYFDFVWSSLRRLGVAESALDDAAQDVFLVVHRRLGEFEGRSTLRTWLFGVALRTARHHRRSAGRRAADPLPDGLCDPEAMGPEDATVRANAVRLLYAMLDSLEEDRRTVFVMMDLEQMSAPEVSEALGVNLNTVYSRHRAARRDFEAALARYRARSRA
jgi:RNA polymerase sigma-70 factor, ECF subfamily